MSGVPGGHDPFDLRFVIAVSSIVVQGSLLPAVAKKLDMIDAEGDVARTLTTTATRTACRLSSSKVGVGHPFAGRSLADIGSATDMLVVLVCAMARTLCCPTGIS
ncbi:MAG: hypothetical protein ACLU0O_12410 [Collinsella sp.]